MARARIFQNKQEFASERTVSCKYIFVIYKNILTKF